MCVCVYYMDAAILVFGENHPRCPSQPHKVDSTPPIVLAPSLVYCMYEYAYIYMY